MNQKETLSAKVVVNTYSFEQLKSLLLRYGELKRAGAISAAIVKARELKPIETTAQLNEVLRPFLQRGREHKGLAQVYQAIRIEVNQEIEALKGAPIANRRSLATQREG